jgi:hypothetical protein
MDNQKWNVMIIGGVEASAVVLSVIEPSGLLLLLVRAISGHVSWLLTQEAQLLLFGYVPFSAVFRLM